MGIYNLFNYIRDECIMMWLLSRATSIQFAGSSGDLKWRANVKIKSSCVK